jgi:shikimate kinase
MTISFKQFMSESINDKGIMKAVFVIGLPGAGKSYTVKQMQGTVSPRIVNTDKAAEFLSKKWHMPINSDTWKNFQDKTSVMTKTMLSNYLNGLLPLFVDGTSNDVSNILHRIGILESLGYDVGVVFVKTDLETAKARAKAREKETGRAVDEAYIDFVHSQNEENAAYLKSKVGFFKEVVNNGDELTDKEMTAAFNAAQGFFDEPVKNPVGKRILQQMKDKKQSYLIPEIMAKEVLDNKVSGWYRK